MGRGYCSFQILHDICLILYLLYSNLLTDLLVYLFVFPFVSYFFIYFFQGKKTVLFVIDSGFSEEVRQESSTAEKVSVFGVILVRIFPHSDGIRRHTPSLSVFNPNAGKCGPE